MKKLLLTLAIIFLPVIAWAAYLNSTQLAPTPVNGNCLQTNGTINNWSSCGGASLSGGSTNSLTYWTSGTTVGATSSPTVGYITATSTTATSTFANGIYLTSGCFELPSGACAGTGGGGGLTSVGISLPTGLSVSNSPLVANGTLAVTLTGGYIIPLSGSTTLPYLASVTADSPLSGSGTSGSHLTISTAGTWSGNAGTATALAANGTNCTAGNYALGVDASGNAEGCTAAAVGTVTGVTGTWPVSVTAGATPNVSFGGLSTSSAAVIGNIPYFTGVNTFGNLATTSVTCSGSTSCTGFTVFGSSPITISSTGGAGSAAGTWSTTTSQTAGQLVNYSNNTTDIVSVGANSTTTAKFYVDPNLGQAVLNGGGAGTSTLSIGSSTHGGCTQTWDAVNTTYNKTWMVGGILYADTGTCTP
jgi:hypothetical protein